MANRQGGFTLFELLLVLVLVALGLSVAQVAVSHGLDAARSREAGRELALALRQTRSLAISRGEPLRLTFDTAQPGYRQADAGWHRLPAGTRLQLTTAAALRQGAFGAVLFYPDGSSSGGSLTLARDGHRWMIDIGWLTGRVRWHEVAP